MICVPFYWIMTFFMKPKENKILTILSSLQFITSFAQKQLRVTPTGFFLLEFLKYVLCIYIGKTAISYPTYHDMFNSYPTYMTVPKHT